MATNLSKEGKFVTKELTKYQIDFSKATEKATFKHYLKFKERKKRVVKILKI